MTTTGILDESGLAQLLQFALGCPQDVVGSPGRPDEVVNVALFLASAESSYVTGVDIVVDGGMKVW